ncbi:HrpE/YscL family type III secretion apparatus protein [Mesorhizobium sp. M4B.F.Ca.ET.215.01.1.1]|uniref:type III secretion system stator protein SctL n=3 Tax=Mesorhizobium TaxID=68287 RepID=UPI000FC9AE3D|nr:MULTISPECIES: type III secretion system stator protein SctL [unclassified Mesorhizobium]RUW19082.1 HrpE/YscL family type III secretion apparatus protein [Mesorhizobium sp. M4B.F.Ca.ET.013.02.1.1]RVD33846.1 HrpE/YscL family type III secretion apparatus protein [Mesorhizobium sp. M4B.F.Ca.ET.019.03.1.1]TGQ09423.1 HrpE/YscL family type III secretion apparatus protein [Mesorhizobium sp. M4B.F.Ca.ET.215.01.1.1]TGQ31133.1 HrpE/YscL family type III secretion apparatus protein [Mesorhizobium sp. M4B
MIEPGKAIDAMPRRPSARILRAAEARAWQDGHAFLDEARHDAQQLREAARRAYAAEYAQGYEDGKAQGDADATRLIGETAVKVDRYLAGLETEVIGLAIEIVRRMLGEFDVGTLVAKAARQAVSEIRRAKYLKVRVHPASVDRVRDELNAVLRDSDLGMTVEIDADDALAVGACIVSTDFAVVDASIDAQLKAIAAAIASKAEVA